MNIYGKLLGWLVLAATPFFLVSCNDDDDNNSENKTVETPQLLELSDSKGDLMFYTYDSKDRPVQIFLYDDGRYQFVKLGYNPLKMTKYKLDSEDSEYDEQTLFDYDELGKISDIKTDKNGNITSCKVTKKKGVVNAKITYDSQQHPVKIVHSYTDDEWSSTDIAELKWEKGNMTHYTLTDEAGLYLESIVEYGNAKNITGQATYGLILAYWNDLEYFTGVLGKLSNNLPSKVTTKYYEDKVLTDTDEYNISYSYGDNDDVVEEYIDNDKEDFWVSHLGEHLKHYTVYHGYRK